MSKFFVTLVFALGLWGPGLAFADIRLVYVKVSQSSQMFVIPVKDGETQQQALAAYFSAMADNASLRGIYERLVKTPLDGFVEDVKNAQAILIAANHAEDHSPTANRIHGVLAALKRVRKEVAEGYAVMPVGASLRLNPEERREFHKKLKARFQLLMVLGGDDVHPSFYREQITYSQKPNYTRDFLEITLIRDFYRPLGSGDANTNIIFGICRGSQIIKVALEGKTLSNSVVQDILKAGLTTIPHNLGEEMPIQVRPNVDPYLSAALSNPNPNGPNLNLYMYHHQAIRDQPGSMLQIVATTSDGIPVAYVSNDGRVVGIQGHPELQPTIEMLGVQVFAEVIARGQPRAKTCEMIL